MFDKGANLSDEGLRHLADQITVILKDRFASYQDHKPRRTLRMSNIGKNPLQLWYEINAPEIITEPFTPEDKLKFLYGDIIEALVVFLAKEAGHTIADEQGYCNLDGVEGHLDCTIDGEVVDVKSVSGNSFFKFSDPQTFARLDSFGYSAQLSAYCESRAKDRGFFLAVNKETGALQLLPHKTESVRERIAELRAILASPEPPYHCSNDKELPNGNRVLKSPCTYCKYKKECWKDANDGQGLRTFTYSDGPKHFTKVQKAPRVDEVTNNLTFKKKDK